MSVVAEIGCYMSAMDSGVILIIEHAGLGVIDRRFGGMKVNVYICLCAADATSSTCRLTGPRTS